MEKNTNAEFDISVFLHAGGLPKKRNSRNPVDLANYRQWYMEHGQ